MGKAIEQEALQRGHSISFRIGRANAQEISAISPENTDAVIEFTHPASTVPNIQTLLPTGLPLVIGTTGWLNELPQVRQWVEAQRACLVYGANFSIGVNILFKLNKLLADAMNSYPQYDPYIEELHHRHKADAPSGTALKLAQQLLESLTRKTAVAGDLSQRKPADNELSVGYVRAGEIIGTHRVAYHSDIDTIEIIHTAHSRRGFALGAVVAAEAAMGRTGVWDFADIV